VAGLIAPAQLIKGATLGICAWQDGQRKGPDHAAAK
jgi:hypothetical protein